MKAVSCDVGFQLSSPITSGDNIISALPKAILHVIDVYVLGTCSDGLWAQALLMTGVESAPQKIQECLSLESQNHTESQNVRGWKGPLGVI